MSNVDTSSTHGCFLNLCFILKLKYKVDEETQDQVRKNPVFTYSSDSTSKDTYALYLMGAYSF